MIKCFIHDVVDEKMIVRESEAVSMNIRIRTKNVLCCKVGVVHLLRCAAFIGLTTMGCASLVG